MRESPPGRVPGRRLRRWRVRLPLRYPWNGLSFRQALIVEGPAGWGEASPLPGYPCHPARSLRSAREAAVGAWPPPVRDRVRVSALIPALAPLEAAALAREEIGRGISCVKVKLGRGDDLGRVGAVRDAVGPDVQIRVDPNGVWDLDSARRHLTALARYDLEFAEQPVASLDDLARLRRMVDVPLAADEVVRSVDDARRLVRLDAADLLVVKVQPLGGVRGALEVVEAAGLPVVVGSMLETSVGLAAGLALAAALPELPYACGLATATLLAGDLTDDPLVPRDGRLEPRPVPASAARLARYAT